MNLNPLLNFALSWHTLMTSPRDLLVPKHIFSLIFALLLVIAFPAQVASPFLSQPFAVLLTIVVVAVLYKVVLLATLRLSSPSARPAVQLEHQPLSRYLLFFVLLAAVYSTYLAAFFPAVMSYDSVNQWHQMATFSFNDRHPPLYALTMWLLTRLWFSPAAVAAFQIALQALAVCFALLTLARLGASKTLLWSLALFFALFPVYGIYSVILWKDVPYSVCLLLLTVMLLRVLSSGGAALDSRLFQAGLGVILALIALLRHDGVLPYAGATVALLVLVWKRPRRLLSVLVVSLGLILLVRFPVYSGLNVLRVEGSILTGKLYLFQIAAVVVSGGSITSRELEIIEEILPLEVIKEHYTPYTSDTLLLARGTKLEWLKREGRKQELFRLWLELVRRNPAVIAHQISRNRSILWRVVEFPDAYTASYWLSIDPNMDGLSMSPIHRGWHEFLKNGILGPLGMKREFNWLFFRPALFLYLALFAVSIVAFRIGSVKGLLLIVPLAMSTATFVLLCPVQDTRYFYAAFLIAPFLLAASLVLGRGELSAASCRPR
jgi:hypothetical protein